MLGKGRGDFFKSIPWVPQHTSQTQLHTPPTPSKYFNCFAKVQNWGSKGPEKLQANAWTKKKIHNAPWMFMRGGIWTSKTKLSFGVVTPSKDKSFVSDS